MRLKESLVVRELLTLLRALLKVKAKCVWGGGLVAPEAIVGELDLSGDEWVKGRLSDPRDCLEYHLFVYQESRERERERETGVTLASCW